MPCAVWQWPRWCAWGLTGGTDVPVAVPHIPPPDPSPPDPPVSQTRWGALKARELLRMYDKEYAALCKAFAEKRPVKECIAILESS